MCFMLCVYALSPTFPQTLRTYGFGGLYCGQRATIMREIPGNVAWFSVYEITREV